MPRLTSGKPTREQLQAAYGESIPDLIAPGLRVLFIGINPSLYSAAVGHQFSAAGESVLAGVAWGWVHRPAARASGRAAAAGAWVRHHEFGRRGDSAGGRADPRGFSQGQQAPRAEGPALSPAMGGLSRHLDVSIGGRSTRDVSRSAEGQIRRLARVAVAKSQRTQRALPASGPRAVVPRAASAKPSRSTTQRPVR